MQIFYEMPLDNFITQDFEQMTTPLFREQLVRDETSLLPEDENAYFLKAKAFFEKALKSLDLASAQIEQIREIGLEYPKTKNPDDIKKLAAARDALQACLDDSIYRYAAFPEDFSPLYNIWIFAGRHIDQSELFRLGARQFGENSPEKISVAGLKLDTIDVTTPSSVWLALCDGADLLISQEKEKIKTYLERIDFFMLYNDIQRKVGFEHFSVKSPILFLDPSILQKSFCDNTMGFLDLQIALLKKIQKLAADTARAAEKKDLSPVIFHTRQMADEINRLSSHASFNGMTLLQGFWGEPSDDAPWKRPFIFNLGIGSVKKENLGIGQMTTHTLLDNVFKVRDWEYDFAGAFTDISSSQKAVQELDISIKKVEAEKAALKRIADLVPADSALNDKLLNAAVLEMKEKLVKDYALTGETDFTPLPGLSVNANIVLYLIVLDNAYTALLDMFFNLKTVAIANNFLFYSEAEYQQLLAQGAAWLEKSKRLIAGLKFNAKKYFESSDQPSEKSFSLLLDERGKWQKTLTVYPLTADSLGLGQFGEMFSPPYMRGTIDYMNRALSEIDVLCINLLQSRYRIEFVLGSALVCAKKDALLEDFAKNKSAAKLSSGALLGFFELERLVLAQIEFYARSAVNSFYIDSNRVAMNEHIAVLASDAEMLIRECYAQIEQAGQEPWLNASDQAKILDLKTKAKSLWAGIAQLKDEKGNFAVVSSEADAEKLFLRMAEIMQAFR